MQQFIRNKNGVTIIVVALLMFVFLGLVALAIDLGYMFTQKSHLQNASDASALAGAGDICKYETAAKQLVKLNGVDPNKAVVNVERPNENQATVTVKVIINDNYNTFFAGILGINSVDIGTKAVATTTGPKCAPTGDMIPIAIYDGDIPKEPCISDIDMCVYEVGSEIEIWNSDHCQCNKETNHAFIKLPYGDVFCFTPGETWIEGETTKHKCSCRGEDINITVGQKGILVVFDEYRETGRDCGCGEHKYREYRVANLLAIEITGIGHGGGYGCCHNEYIKAKLIEWRHPDVTAHPSVPFNPTLPTPPRLIE